MAGRSVINVLVNADTRDFVGGMDTASRKVGSFVGGSVKNLAKLGAAFAAAGAVAAGVFAKSAISAAEEMATANDRIRQINESMGLFGDESAMVSDRLITLSNEMARLTGVSQNEIKEAQALLLTFGEIANSADEVGGAFDRATQLTVDMAAAGFGSATDNAKQLGKALNDPIRGISALARSGVTFTEQEKELIKTLVESGKQLEAQDMILSAIEAQVGGTAEATANASDKIRVAFSQVMERAGVVLLPLFEKLTNFLLDTAFPVLEKVAAAFGDDGMAGGMSELGNTLKSVISRVLPVLSDWLQKIGSWFVSDALPYIGRKLAELGQALVDWVQPRIKPALEALGELLGKLGSWIIDDALPWLGKKLAELGKALVDWIEPRIIPFLKALGDFIAAGAQWFVDDGLPMMVDKLIVLGDALVDWVKPRIVPLLEELGKLLVAILDWIITDALPKIVKEVAKLAVAFVGWVVDIAPELIKGLGTALGDLGKWIVSDGIPTLVSQGLSLGSSLIGALLDGLANIGGFALNIGRSIANGLIGFLNGIIEDINNLLEFKVPLPFGASFTVNPPDIPNIPTIGGGAQEGFVALANGGIVTSPTLALIGEAGPEAVVPLTGANAGAVGGQINVTVNAGVGTDGVAVGRQIVQILNEYSASGGARLVSDLVGG